MEHKLLTVLILISGFSSVHAFTVFVRESMCYALLTTLGCFFLGFSTSQVYQQSMDVYYFVSELKTFAEAQLYCRATYTDLVTIENTDDLHTLQTDQVTYRECMDRSDGNRSFSLALGSGRQTLL